MRVAERREHAAQICRNVLHDKGERHVFLLARGGKNIVAKGQKREERHVIGNEHGADKGDVYQGEHAHPCGFAHVYDARGKHVKEVDILQRTHHCQNAKQATQGLKIEVLHIGAVDRNYQHGNDRGDQRNKHDRVSRNQSAELVSCRFEP